MTTEFDMEDHAEWNRFLRAEEVSALKRENDHLRRIIDAINRLGSCNPNAGPATLAEDILSRMNGHPVSLSFMCRATGRADNQVGTSFTALVKAGKVRRVNRGMYQRVPAAEFHDGKQTTGRDQGHGQT